jgi:hypothetical protein
MAGRKLLSMPRSVTREALANVDFDAAECLQRVVEAD